MSPARSLAPLLALALAACATTGGLHASASHAYAVGPRAPAEECRPFEGSANYLLDAGETTERQVLGLSCFDRYERPELSSRGYVQLHAAFDDRLFDPVSAAIMVVGCVGDGACRADVEPESLGQMVHYARSLDLTKLQVALQATRVPSRVADAFVLRAQASKDVVLEEMSRLDARRTRLYVEIPEQVRARAKAHWQAFDAFYRRYDALVPRIDLALKQHGGADHVQQQLATETAKLRDDYLARCAARSRSALECLAGPIARPLTQRLVQLAIRLGDPLLAQAENALLGLAPDRGTIAQQIALEQGAAVEEEQTQFSRWSEARSDGVDDQTLQLAFGNPSPVDVPALAWKPVRDMGALRSQLRHMQAPVDVVRGTVRFVRAKGDQMEIYFAEDPAPADCGDQEIPEGAIEEIRCEVETPHVPVSRLYLAANEAKPLLIGNRLEAVVDRESHRAATVQVFQSRKAENLVQLRAARIR